MDPYATLGVSPGISPEDLKKAYRAKAMEHHPDRQDGDEEKFKQVTEAYEILTGKRQQRGQQRDPGGQPTMDELLNMLRNQQAQGGYNPRNEKPPLSDHGVPIQFKTTIGRIKDGIQEPITYHLAVDCKDCSGIGGSGKKACGRCGGQGILLFQQSQGTMTFQTYGPCPHCEARGYHFEKTCDSCTGNGWTLQEKSCIVEIREKK